MCLKIALYSLFVQAGFCLILILRKNKGFQSGALLRMSTSSPYMEELCLDFQKQVSLKDLTFQK